MLSNMQVGTRKDIKTLVRHKRVTVNDRTARSSSIHIDPNQDVVKVDGEVIEYFENLTLMMHKPSGFLSSTHDPSGPTVMDLLPDAYVGFNFSIAGRLDKDATGLLVLTTDGKLVHDVISPNKDVYKTYDVIAAQPVENADDLLKPMQLYDAHDRLYDVKPPKVIEVNGHHVRLAICEGKFHQVKRMFEAIGHHVVSLKRIKIHELTLDPALSEGEVKLLNDRDIALLTKK